MLQQYLISNQCGVRSFSVGRLQAEWTVFRNVFLKRFPMENNPDILLYP